MSINHFHKNKSHYFFLKKALGFIRISIIIRLKPKFHQNLKSERNRGEPCGILNDSKMKTDKIKKEQSQDRRNVKCGTTAARGRRSSRE